MCFSSSTLKKNYNVAAVRWVTIITQRQQQYSLWDSNISGDSLVHFEEKLAIFTQNTALRTIDNRQLQMALGE